MEVVSPAFLQGYNGQQELSVVEKPKFRLQKKPTLFLSIGFKIF
jgi:hypothetical protein